MKEKEKEISSIDSLFWRIAIKDDEIAFRTLFFQFFSPLCVFAHRYIDRWETCEDIVQETFFKIWKNRKNIEINTSIRNFLITSVKNTCIDFLRKQETEQNWQQKEIRTILHGIPPEISTQRLNWNRCFRQHLPNFLTTYGLFLKKTDSKV